MVKIVSLRRNKKQRRLVSTGLLITLLTATGIVLCRLPLSLQHIGSFLQGAVGKLTDNPTNTIFTSPVSRGSIYDSRHQELATTYLFYNLAVRPSELEDQSALSQSLAAILGEKRIRIANKIKQKKQLIEIADTLDTDQADRIRKLGIKGVYLQPVQNRFYPEHTTGAHLIGFARNNIGLSGVEGLYDTILQPGEFKAGDVPEIDFKNEKIIGRSTTDIILTLDLLQQKKLEKYLRELREKLNLARISAIVLNPKNGAVLAMAILPTFNPNYFWQTDDIITHDTVFKKDIDLELIQPLLFPIAAIMQKNDPNYPILPVGIAAHGYGLSSADLYRFTENTKRLNTNIYGLPGRFETVVKQTLPDDFSLPKNESTSAVQLAATIASFINGGWTVTPYILKGLFDHNSGKTFLRSQVYDKASRLRIMSPAMGVRVRKELAAMQWSGDRNTQLIVKVNQRLLTHEKTSKYLRQNILLGWTPKKKPDMLLLLSGQRQHLAPPYYNDYQETDILAATGLDILNTLKKVAVQTAPKQFPIARDHENYQQFLISHNIHFRRPFDSPVPKTAGTMPDTIGLSLRNGLQRLNYLNLKISIKGHGRIISQTPAAGTTLADEMACTLTLAEKM